MNAFNETARSGLIWLPELGMGHYPVARHNRPYDGDYFSRYQLLADTPTGHALTSARIELVARHYSGPLLDVGIGSGQFVGARPNTQGFDVNPAGIRWLMERGKWSYLYDCRHDALSFWDSLEHIDRPDIAVEQSARWVFVSVPVFDSGEQVLHSRHFRKTEHIWYWTHEGLVRWFAEQGFELAEHNQRESALGREGIGSYAFRRVRDV